jgi:hypothetical protein
MALTACTECGKDISTKAAACPQCGAKRPRSWTWLWILVGLVVALFTFGYIAASTPGGKARIKDKLAIETCWNEQKRQANDPSTAAVVTGACVMLEDEYERKYGYRP